MDTRVCAICKQEKPLVEFARSTQRKNGYGSYCKPCDNERKKQWRQAGGDRVRAYHNEYRKRWKKENPELEALYARRTDLKRKYGITIEEYEQILESQGNKCAICPRVINSEERNFPVDHCHKTGKIRGILCSNCNRGLGFFSDDEELLANAIHYLRSC